MMRIETKNLMITIRRKPSEGRPLLGCGQSCDKFHTQCSYSTAGAGPAKPSSKCVVNCAVEASGPDKQALFLQALDERMAYLEEEVEFLHPELNKEDAIEEAIRALHEKIQFLKAKRLSQAEYTAPDGD